MFKRMAAIAATTALALAGLSGSARATTFYDVTSATEDYGPSVATVSRPVGATGARPTVYFVHGGSWTGGSRADWAQQAFDYAHRGWVSINIEYRLGVLDGVPDDGLRMLSDVSAAVAYFKAKSYTADNQMVIQGDSAGGHLAATVAVKAHSEFKGILLWSPASSPWNAPQSSQLLGKRANEYWNGISQGVEQTVAPYRYVKAYADEPPIWSAWSSGEWLIPSTQGALLCSYSGAVCESHATPGDLHGTDLRDAHPELVTDAYQWASQKVGY